jgi:DUF4097 and DUF4098 domain-containing protein YvlB
MKSNQQAYSTAKKRTSPALSMGTLLFSLLALQLSACTWIYKEPVEVVRHYPLSQGASLNLFTSGGSITVTGEPGLEEAIVEFKIFNYTDEHPLTDEEVELLFEDLNLEIESNRDELSISYARDFNLIGNATSVSYTVRVPSETTTTMRTSGGSLRLYNLDANAEMSTSGGSVRIEQVNGDVVAKTSGGSIRVEKVNGATDVVTSGGSLRFTDCVGSIEGQTSGGSIRVLNASAFSKINLKTSGGSISLNDVSLENVSLEAKGSRVRMSTASDFSGTIERDYVNGSFGSGSIPVSLRTSGGSVRINQE